MLLCHHKLLAVGAAGGSSPTDTEAPPPLVFAWLKAALAWFQAKDMFVFCVALTPASLLAALKAALAVFQAITPLAEVNAALATKNAALASVCAALAASQATFAK